MLVFLKAHTYVCINWNYYESHGLKYCSSDTLAVRLYDTSRFLVHIVGSRGGCELSSLIGCGSTNDARIRKLGKLDGQHNEEGRKKDPSVDDTSEEGKPRKGSPILIPQHVDTEIKQTQNTNKESEVGNGHGNFTLRDGLRRNAVHRQ